MQRFKLTNKAREDLIGIARFTEAAWGRNQRRFYLKQMDETFHALAADPELGRSCAEIRQGYFKYPRDSHIIFYRLGTESSIEVIRVLHKRMDVALHL
ncbi:MAG: type II toxin-antitoxin system RelE/ParE family toxin [Pseudomonadales bacterium]|nr:type II toxin-antitoxin system RelE/ParE family toxin [Pseudomonadales bacterium]